MTRSRVRAALLASVCGAVLASCGGGGGGSAPPLPPPPPPVNGLPDISTALSVEVDENDSYVFQVDATDPDGDTLEWRLNASEDSALFTIDSATGVISTVPPNYVFDHENPGDANGDNDYILEVSVSDGKDRISEGLTIRVLDVYEPPFCRTAGALTVDENTQGLLDTFGQVVPEEDETFVRFRDLQSSAIANGADIFTLDADTGEVRATEPIDFETFGDTLELTATAEFSLSTAMCTLVLTIVDDPGRVASGARLEGYRPLEGKALGDLDGNGTDDLFVRTGDAAGAIDTTVPPFGLFVRGESLGAAIAPAADGVFDATGDDVIALRASFDGDVDEHALRAPTPADVDGDGDADLVLDFSWRSNIAPRAVPLAFVVWDETLADAAVTDLDLANLSASQGLTITAGTAAGDDREGVTSATRTVAGDFDGDGRVELAVSLPFSADPDDPPSEQGNVYIIDDTAITAATGTLSLDALDGDQAVRLTGDRELGVEMLAVQSVDGDAADELVIVGGGFSYVVAGADIADLLATGVAGSAVPASAVTALPGTVEIAENFLQPADSTADFDSDGLQDIPLVIGNSLPLRGAVASGADIAGDTGLPFALEVSVDVGDFASNPQVGVMGDLNGDGVPEMLFHSSVLLDPTDPEAFNESVVSIVDGATLAASGSSGGTYNVTGDAVAGAHITITGVNDDFAVETPMVGQGDYDGDGVPDLFIANRRLNRGLLLLGSDLADALANGENVSVDTLINVEG